MLLVRGCRRTGRDLLIAVGSGVVLLPLIWWWVGLLDGFILVAVVAGAVVSATLLHRRRARTLPSPPFARAVGPIHPDDPDDVFGPDEPVPPA